MEKKFHCMVTCRRKGHRFNARIQGANILWVSTWLNFISDPPKGQDVRPTLNGFKCPFCEADLQQDIQETQEELR